MILLMMRLGGRRYEPIRSQSGFSSRLWPKSRPQLYSNPVIKKPADCCQSAGLRHLILSGTISL
jgi:hypothetical protein